MTGRIGATLPCPQADGSPVRNTHCGYFDEGIGRPAARRQRYLPLVGADRQMALK